MMNVFWTSVVEYFMLLILWYFYLDALLHKCTWLKGLDIFLMPETQISMAKKKEEKNPLPLVLHLMQLRNDQWTW